MSNNKVNQKQKLFIKTYGCQMNVYDSERMSDILKPLGYMMTDTPDGADMIILNTCHIREKATEKVFSDLGRIKPHKDKNEKMIVAVAGCVAQAEGAEIIKRAPYVDMVFGPQTYHQLPEMIARAKRSIDAKNAIKDGKEITHGRGILNVDFPIESKFDFLPEHDGESKSSAFVTIQEGCDKFCKFCCVPYTRGAEYSRPVDDILTECKKLIDQGVIEITLLGQNVNAYHGKTTDGKEIGLGKLITEVDKLGGGLQIIRYTTSHPNDVDEELIEAHGKIRKLAPYLHLPVQSGSDDILQHMNRKHNSAKYIEIIGKLRKARPDIAFSSDFIVGYPGENEKDFEKTYDMVEKVNFAQAFSFKYSRRLGTPAAAMDDQIPDEVKTNRLMKLQSLLQDQQAAFNKSKVGKILPVLFEKKGKKSGQIIGKSLWLQSVIVEADESLIGKLVNTKIIAAGLNSLMGEIQEPNSGSLLSPSSSSSIQNNDKAA